MLPNQSLPKKRGQGLLRPLNSDPQISAMAVMTLSHIGVLKNCSHRSVRDSINATGTDYDQNSVQTEYVSIIVSIIIIRSSSTGLLLSFTEGVLSIAQTKAEEKRSGNKIWHAASAPGSQVTDLERRL